MLFRLHSPSSAPSPPASSAPASSAPTGPGSASGQDGRVLGDFRSGGDTHLHIDSDPREPRVEPLQSGGEEDGQKTQDILSWETVSNLVIMVRQSSPIVMGFPPPALISIS